MAFLSFVNKSVVMRDVVVYSEPMCDFYVGTSGEGEYCTYGSEINLSEMFDKTEGFVKIEGHISEGITDRHREEGDIHVSNRNGSLLSGDIVNVSDTILVYVYGLSTLMGTDPYGEDDYVNNLFWDGEGSVILSYSLDGNLFTERVKLTIRITPN